MSEPRAWASTRLGKVRVKLAVRTRLENVKTQVRSARGRRMNHVLVLGDSHVGVFLGYPFPEFQDVSFDLAIARGASLAGLENPNSTSGARGRFDRAVDSAVRNDRGLKAIIVLVGEVDLGFLIWYREATSGASPEALMDLALERLDNYLRELRAVAPTFFISVPLPTIADASAYAEYAGFRRGFDIAIEKRMSATLAFNGRARELCERLGVGFMDLDPLSTTDSVQVIPALCNADPSDHHYDRMVYGRLVERVMSDSLRPLMD